MYAPLPSTMKPLAIIEANTTDTDAALGDGEGGCRRDGSRLGAGRGRDCRRRKQLEQE